MEDIQLSNISIDRLTLSVFNEKNIEAVVLRLDKIHPVISGNKWFKLRYYLEEARQLNKKRVITFGGAWSNHIVATAAACKLYSFDSTGIIRGEKPAIFSPTLKEAEALGMQLIFISRGDFKQKKIPVTLLNNNSYIINEGGWGSKGAEGAATILDYCKQENYSHICCACGTGTMAAGLVRRKVPGSKLIALSVMKNNSGAEESIKSLLIDHKMDFTVIHDYHFGGYAKHNPALLSFMNEFYRQTSVPTDFVYTGKLFFGIYDLITQNHFPEKCKLLIIHSGGLQGNASLSKGTLIF